MSYKGIKKIKIPVKAEEIATAEGFLAVLQNYLNSCLMVHNDNVTKEKKLLDYYKGNQDILQKERPYTNKGNNTIVENHAKRQVDFKVDFLLGDKMQFTHKSEDCNDDLHIFNRFLSDSGFYTEQREYKKDCYIYGVGVTFAQPRTDIIDNDYNYSEEYNKDTEAPFNINCVSPTKNFVVYSSYIGEMPLFGINIADVTDNVEDENLVQKYIITVYSKNYTISFSGSPGFQVIDFNKPTEPIIENEFKDIPIIEHYYNKERMGVIEVNKSLYDSINFIVSNAADAAYDSVNKVFVIKNASIESTEDDNPIADMIEAGIIELKTNVPETPADCYTIDMEYSQADANTFYEQRVSKAYDIAGVPLASGVTTSGGDTGKARLLGGGWENAYTIIKGDIIGFEKCDYALLNQLLKICHTIPDTKVNELYASQIELHYNINPNDNILVKTQSAVNLYGINYPLEGILKVTGLSFDTCADANKWQGNIDKAEELNLKELKETKFINDSQNDNNETQNDKNNVADSGNADDTNV